MTLIINESVGTGPYLRGGDGFKPSEINDEKTSASVFHISVQWSFNVDQFMQTFDS